MYSGKVDPERAARGMADPEIQRILQDPTVSQVLRDMGQNPMAAQNAMKNPGIAAKIEKLV